MRADGADEQDHLSHLQRELMFDTCADLGFEGVCLSSPLQHRLALRPLPMDTAYPALPHEPCLTGLAGICGVRPHIRGIIVTGHVLAQHPPVEAGTFGALGFADEAKAPAKVVVALVAEARDGDVNAGSSVRHWSGLGKLQRPVLAGSSRQFLRASLPTLIASFLGSVLRRLSGATSVASTI